VNSDEITVHGASRGRAWWRAVTWVGAGLGLGLALFVALASDLFDWEGLRWSVHVPALALSLGSLAAMAWAAGGTTTLRELVIASIVVAVFALVGVDLLATHGHLDPPGTFLGRTHLPPAWFYPSLGALCFVPVAVLFARASPDDGARGWTRARRRWLWMAAAMGALVCGGGAATYAGNDPAPIRAAQRELRGIGIGEVLVAFTAAWVGAIASARSPADLVVPELLQQHFEESVPPDLRPGSIEANDYRWLKDFLESPRVDATLEARLRRTCANEIAAMGIEPARAHDCVADALRAEAERAEKTRSRAAGVMVGGGLLFGVAAVLWGLTLGRS
jgi:hypothetical protein